MWLEGDVVGRGGGKGSQSWLTRQVGWLESDIF